MSNIFSGIAWYYGDNDFIIQKPLTLIVHLNAACVTCRTDMGFHMTCSTDIGFHITCSTDLDSRVTCSKKYIELHVLHGFTIDSHMFAWVKHMIT